MSSTTELVWGKNVVLQGPELSRTTCIYLQLSASPLSTVRYSLLNPISNWTLLWSIHIVLEGVIHSKTQNKITFPPFEPYTIQMSGKREIKGVLIAAPLKYLSHLGQFINRSSGLQTLPTIWCAASRCCEIVERRCRMWQPSASPFFPVAGPLFAARRGVCPRDLGLMGESEPHTSSFVFLNIFHNHTAKLAAT